MRENINRYTRERRRSLRTFGENGTNVPFLDAFRQSTSKITYTG
jgi:hypothetical protein